MESESLTITKVSFTTMEGEDDMDHVAEEVELDEGVFEEDNTPVNNWTRKKAKSQADIHIKVNATDDILLAVASTEYHRFCKMFAPRSE